MPNLCIFVYIYACCSKSMQIIHSLEVRLLNSQDLGNNDFLCFCFFFHLFTSLKLYHLE